MKYFTHLFLSVFLCWSCVNNKVKKEEILPAITETVKVSYLLDIEPIITKNCLECHFENSNVAPHNWSNPAEFKEYALKSSGIEGFTEVQARLKGKKERMPLGKNPLSDADIAKIDLWISQGASIE